MNPLYSKSEYSGSSVQYAPVSGEVVEVNERLDGEPGLVNRRPDDEGK